MDSFKGTAFFYDAASGVNDFGNVMGLAGLEEDGSAKILISNNMLPSPAKQDEFIEYLLSQKIYCLFAQDFDDSLRASLLAKKILPVEIRRKDLQEIFASFAEKDTEAIVFNEFEAGSKLKLISGSFSKSYVFHMDEDAKAVLADDGWPGYQG